MKFEFEVTPNPGTNAKFVTEVRFEKNAPVWGSEDWWGLWLTFWLYPRRLWREWLWGYENSVEDRCRVLKARLCGFEATRQTTKGQAHAY